VLAVGTRPEIQHEGATPAAALFPLFGPIVAITHRRQSDRHDVSPYFAICILAAAAANSQTVWFYAGMFAIAAWALWFANHKPRGRSLGCDCDRSRGGGYAGHAGLHSLQGKVEGKIRGLVPGGGAGPVSSLRNTAIAL